MSLADKISALLSNSGTSIDHGFLGLTGVVLAFAGTTAPTGWLMCAGQAVSRTTYAALFAVIGTTYGAGDGTTTFNVPDLRGRVIAGVDNMGGTAANRLTAGGSGVAGTLGAAGGAETHTLTETQMPSHSHKASDPFNDTGVGWNVMGGGSQGRLPSHQYAAQTTYAGGGGAHNNTQPTMCENYIIRT